MYFANVLQTYYHCFVTTCTLEYSGLGYGTIIHLLPEGLLCRRPQNFDVRLSDVCLSDVTLCFDHFLDPKMCDIALNNPDDRKKEGKKGVP